jgi:hypothetical protein
LSLELKVLIVVTESHAPDILLFSLWFVVAVTVLFFFCENSEEISVSQSRRSWENGGVGIFTLATTRSIYPARMEDASRKRSNLAQRSESVGKAISNI